MRKQTFLVLPLTMSMMALLLFIVAGCEPLSGTEGSEASGVAPTSAVASSAGVTTVSSVSSVLETSSTITTIGAIGGSTTPPVPYTVTPTTEAPTTTLSTASPATTTTAGVILAPTSSVVAMPAAVWTRFEDSACGSWIGAWADSPESGASGGNCRSIDSSGAFGVHFEGTRIALVAGKHPEYGIAYLWLKRPGSIGTIVSTYVDLYSSEEGYERVWTSPVLDHGYYELWVEWTGGRNDAAGGTRITVDAVDVIGRLPSP